MINRKTCEELQLWNSTLGHLSVYQNRKAVCHQLPGSLGSCPGWDVEGTGEVWIQRSVLQGKLIVEAVVFHQLL